jgi:hypothetical protein
MSQRCKISWPHFFAGSVAFPGLIRFPLEKAVDPL